MGCSGWGSVSGWCGGRWPPGITGEGVADAGQDVDAVFADGVDVARLLHFVASWAGATVADGVGT